MITDHAVSSCKKQSPWLDDTSLRKFPTLTHRISVDVLVVGGGIAGITTALLLKQSGSKVALVDRAKIAGGETGHTTAHLTYVSDTRLHELVHKVGRTEAGALWNASDAAIRCIEGLAETYGIDCGLSHLPGYLFAADGKDAQEETETLRQDAALATEMGFPGSLLAMDPVFGRPAVQFPNQMKFHPLRYLAALVEQIPGDGSHVFEKVEGGRIDEDKKEYRTPQGAIHYETLVAATNAPIQGPRNTFAAALFQTKLAAYSTYAIQARVYPDSIAEGLYWDTGDPYHYARFDKHDGETTVIFGGEDHRTGQTEDTEACYHRLEEALRRHFPTAELQYRWSGQVLETPDGLPYIGESSKGQFLATGFSGTGMTLGTFSGMLLRDLILGRPTAYGKIFDPHRKHLSGVWDYVCENKDFPVNFLKDHLSPAPTGPEEIAPGSGGVVKIEGRKCAVYRDEDGKQTTLSAVCPHMGCIVHWNSAEKSWDCPCHGSRFLSTGELMTGPAEAGLEKIAEPKKD